jgi:hypothetical protein
MGIGISIVVALLLVAATVVMHYELLQFAGTLPRRLTVPMRPRIIIVIGVVLAAHIVEASLYAAVYYVLADTVRHGRSERPSRRGPARLLLFLDGHLHDARDR